MRPFAEVCKTEAVGPEARRAENRRCRQLEKAAPTGLIIPSAPLPQKIANWPSLSALSAADAYS